MRGLEMAASIRMGSRRPGGTLAGLRPAEGR